MGKTYAQKLRDPRWQRKRLEVMDRDGFRCLRCQAKDETLNVHHRWYIVGAEPWDYPNEVLETVCEACHAKDHGKGADAPSTLQAPPPPLPQHLKKRLQRAVEGNDLGSERAALRKIQNELQRRHGAV